MGKGNEQQKSWGFPKGHFTEKLKSMILRINSENKRQ